MLLTTGSTAAPVAGIDDRGRALSLPHPAERIVTLAPSLTELVFAAGAEGHLVAVSAWSDYPHAATLLPVVSDVNGVSFESLLAVKPDLVVAWKSGNRPADLDRIAKLGIPVFALEVARLGDVPAALRRIGELAGTSAAAGRAAAALEARAAHLAEARRGEKRLRVFFEISALPLLTINREHAIDEAIELCGGTNVFRDAPLLVFEPSREALLKADPDVILYSARRGSGRVPAFDAGLRAVRDARLYPIDADLITRAGPRMIAGVEEVCAALGSARRAPLARPLAP